MLKNTRYYTTTTRLLAVLLPILGSEFEPHAAACQVGVQLWLECIVLSSYFVQSGKYVAANEIDNYKIDRRTGVFG